MAKEGFNEDLKLIKDFMAEVATKVTEYFDSVPGNIYLKQTVLF